MTGNKKEFGIGQKSSSPTLDLFSQSVDPNYPTLYLQKQLSIEISTDLKKLEAPPTEFKISSESVLPRKGNEGSSSVSNKVSIDLVELAKTLTSGPLTLLLVPESGRAAITDSTRSKGIFVAEQLSNIMREEFRIGGIPLIIPLQLKPSLEETNILPLSPILTEISKIIQEMDDRIQAFYNKFGDKNAYLAELCRQGDDLAFLTNILMPSKETLLLQDTTIPVMKKIPLTQETLQVYMVRQVSVGSNIPAQFARGANQRTPSSSRVISGGQRQRLTTDEEQRMIPAALRRVSSRNSPLSSPITQVQTGIDNAEALELIVREAIEGIPAHSRIHDPTNAEMRNKVLQKCMQFPPQLIEALAFAQPEIREYRFRLQHDSEARAEVLKKLKSRLSFVEKSQIRQLEHKDIPIPDIEKYLNFLCLESIQLPPSIISCAMPFRDLEAIKKVFNAHNLVQKFLQIEEKLINDNAFLFFKEGEDHKILQTTVLM